MELGCPECLDPPQTGGGVLLLARLGRREEGCVYIAARAEDRFRRLICAQQLEAAELHPAQRDEMGSLLEAARVVDQAQLVRILGVLGDDKTFGLQLSGLKGRPLSQLLPILAQQQGMPTELVVYLLRQALEGWIYARQSQFLGSIARDFEAEGIWVHWSGMVQWFPVDLPQLARAWDSSHKRESTLEAAAKNIEGVGRLLRDMLTLRSERSSKTAKKGCVPLSLAAAASAALSPQTVPSADLEAAGAKLQDIVETSLNKSHKGGWKSIEALLLALDHWLFEYAPQTSQEKLSLWLQQCFGDTIAKDENLASQWSAAAKKHELAQIAPPDVSESPSDAADTFDKSEARVRATPSGGAKPKSCPEGSDSQARPSKMNITLLPTATPSNRSHGSPDPAAEYISPETVLADRYRIAAKLGRGVWGTVYAAQHIEMGRPVAFKLLFQNWSRDAAVAGRFREAARAASALRHQNIVDIIDAGKLDDGRLFLVMEHLEGRSLRDLLRERSPLEFREAAQIGVQLLAALEAAHQQGVMHRDLKPENIMLLPRREGGGDRVKVLDFGIAAATRSEAMLAGIEAMPAASDSIYLAPEQLEAQTAPQPGMDLYAFGAILFELLHGHPPFHGAQGEELSQKKLKEDPPLLLALRRDLPPELCRIVDDCLQRDPNARPHDAGLLKARLLAFLRKHPALQREAEGVEALALRDELEAKASQRKNRKWILAGAGLSVVALALWWNQGSGSDEGQLSQRDAMRRSGALRAPSKPALEAKELNAPASAGPGARARGSQGGESEFAQSIFAPQKRKLNDPKDALRMAQVGEPGGGRPASGPVPSGPLPEHSVGARNPASALAPGSAARIGLPSGLSSIQGQGGRSLTARRNTQIQAVPAIELPESQRPDEATGSEASSAADEGREAKGAAVAGSTAVSKSTSSKARASQAASKLDAALGSLSKGSSSAKKASSSKSSAKSKTTTAKKSSTKRSSTSSRPNAACTTIVKQIDTQGKSISPRELLSRLAAATRERCWSGREGRRDRAKWMVYAYKELKEWQSCINAGEAYRWDRRIASDLAICEARLKRERSQP